MPQDGEARLRMYPESPGVGKRPEPVASVVRHPPRPVDAARRPDQARCPRVALEADRYHSRSCDGGARSLW
jgi:hypothetical protein